MQREAQFSSKILYVYRYLKKIFSLKDDFDAKGTSEFILNNVEFKSANAWTLIFAILIASIGLNTNSAAVIIGAMLISPLMGPIVGAGFALGTYDFELLKRCARNLFLAAFLSIIVSALYFWFSPLSEASSEILSRTRPTLFDLLIALFGGATGIVAVSRTERGNAIPGVAIATALMPPLCASGYGLSSGDIKVFLGALSLFAINSVFIALSTFVFVRYFHFERRKQEGTPEYQNRINRWIGILVILMVIPSGVSAWFLKSESEFNSNSKKFVLNEIVFPNSFVARQSFTYSFKKSKIDLTLVGGKLSDDQIKLLNEKLKSYHLEGTQLKISQSSLADNIEKEIRASLGATNSVQDELRAEIAKQRSVFASLSRQTALQLQVSEELKSVFSQVLEINIDTSIPSEPQSLDLRLSRVNVFWKRQPPKADRAKVVQFLRARLELVEDAQVNHAVRIQ